MKHKLAIIMLLFTTVSNANPRVNLVSKASEKIGVIQSITKMNDYIFIDAKNRSWIATGSGRIVIHAIDNSLKVTDTVRKKEIKFDEISESKKYFPLTNLGVSRNGPLKLPLFTSKRPIKTLVITPKYLSMNRVKKYLKINRNNIQVLILDKEFKYCGLSTATDGITGLLSATLPVNCNKSSYGQKQNNLQKIIKFSEMKIPVLIDHKTWLGQSDPKVIFGKNI